MKTAFKDSSETNMESAVPEYNIYVFHGHPLAGRHHWERRHTTHCVRQAKNFADELYKTRTYPKIEIKKKYFDPRAARQVDSTLKIYQAEGRPKEQPPADIWWRIFFAASFCALGCFMLAAALAFNVNP